MIDTKRAMMGTTLTISTMKDPDPEKAFNIVEQLLSKDIDYPPEDETGSAKDEQELAETLGHLSSGSLEMEEISDLHEETPVPTSELEVDTLLHLPPLVAQEHPVRRTATRRRRSEDQDENAINPADAGESDAVMTYLREIGRVPMITHDREIELAQNIESGDCEAMKQFILANLRLVVSIAKRYVGRGLTLLE
jgi:RNA polymerase primary sigma factor